MKNKNIWLSIFAVVFLVALPRLSLATAPAKAPVSVPTEAITVATVNIQNAKILTEDNDNIQISFDLTNRTGVQPQIKYGVMLVLQNKDGSQIVEDSKVYDPVISLGENDSKSITVDYAAPSFLDGQYTLVIEAENASGLMLGITPAGTVTLKKTTQNSLFLNSCYLTTGTSTTQYAPSMGVSITPTENISAYCQIQNGFGKEVTATPQFYTFYRNAFGNLVATQTGNTLSVPAGNSTQTFSIPKAATPQTYEVEMALLDAQGNTISNKLTFHYIVQGDSATIQNIVFDKDYYQAGQTANISFFWTGATNISLGVKAKVPAPSPVSYVLSAQVKDSNGNICSKEYSQPLDPKNGPVVKLSLGVTSDCLNPEGIFAIKDGSGNLLANSIFSVTSNPKNVPPPTATKNTTNLPMILLVIILLLLAVYFLVKAHKVKAEDAVKPLLFLLVILGGSLMFHQTAKADTFIVGGYTLSANLGQSYSPGAPIYISTSASWTGYGCAYGPCMDTIGSVTYTGAVNGNTQYFVNATLPSPYSTLNIKGNTITYVNTNQYFPSYTNTLVYASPSSPGSYTANFNANISYYFWRIVGQNDASYLVSGLWTGSMSMPYSVACPSGTNWNGSSCVAPPPPVNGGWSGWSPASCPVACGQSASNLTRTCTNPAPANGGADCSGPKTQGCAATASCYIPPTGTLTPASSSCTIKSGDSSCNINYTWTTTNPNADVTSKITSAYPGSNTTVANGNSGSSVPFSIPFSTSSNPSTNPIKFYLYNTSQLDTATATASCHSGTSWDGSKCSPPPPVVPGVWGHWSGYGTCSASCEVTGGPAPTQTKTQTCDNPAPSGGGAECTRLDGTLTDPFNRTQYQTQSCNTTPCTAVCGPTHNNNACTVGSQSNLHENISNWTWYCTGIDNNPIQCPPELKKKPAYQEN